MAEADPSTFVPRRGRPSKKQVALIERAILETARRQFLDEGYDSVSMEGIAAATGVSKGTLYARYPSKDVLFVAVMEDSIRNWSALAANEDHLLSDDIVQRLRHHALVIARSLLWPDVRAFQRLTLANSGRFPELSRALYEQGYLYIVRLIAADIRESAKRDRRRVRDAESVGQQLVAAITGWYIQSSAIRDVSQKELEKFASRTVDLLIAARDAW